MLRYYVLVRRWMKEGAQVRSNKGTGDHGEVNNDTAKRKGEVNTAEQGETANIKQNTTNAGFFKDRRVK